MRKQNAGERKRTVTIVIGPQTEKLMEAVRKAIHGKIAAYEGLPVTYIGMALDDLLDRDCQIHQVPLPPGWMTHYD